MERLFQLAKRSARGIPTALGLLMIVGGSQGQESQHMGVVTAAVLNQYGQPVVGIAHIDVITGVDRAEKVADIQSGDSFKLPYGTYWIECGSGNSAAPAQEVRIDRPAVSVIFAVLPRQPGDGITFPWIIKGIIKPLPSKGETLVARVVSLYSHVMVDSLVGQDGTFSLNIYRMSPYKLWILSRGKVVAERTSGSGSF